MTLKSFYHTMAYEVTKLVHGRPYRYRVQSVRDPETGRARNRWTYLGRADGAPAERVGARRNARDVLLDALARLFERADFDAITASSISAEAGLAHGTFYRYFRNKQEAILALLRRMRDENGRPLDAAVVPADRAAARAAVAAWVHEVLAKPARHPGLIRALFIMQVHDPILVEDRRRRREAGTALVADYLAMLTANGFATLADPAATAATITALIDGTFREAFVSPLDDARRTATTDAIDRIIFGGAT